MTLGIYCMYSTPSGDIPFTALPGEGSTIPITIFGHLHQRNNTLIHRSLIQASVQSLQLRFMVDIVRY